MQLPLIPPTNLLPNDGIAIYHEAVFSPAEADRLFDSLLENTPWQHDEVVMFGKKIVTARKVAWFADEGRSYQYSGTTKIAHDWIEPLPKLKSVAEKIADTPFNSCLLNLYQDGSQGMGWHRDNESSLVPGSPIASISLGASRPFHFKHRETRERITLTLDHGSLLLMTGQIQTHWEHALPKTKKVLEPRINLTFRRMRE